MESRKNAGFSVHGNIEIDFPVRDGGIRKWTRKTFVFMTVRAA
jgi:hypothetical protein